MKSEKLKIGQGGFTLIELLIVIALIGILAVALLSAINPLEQLRKGRDSTRKADTAELLNAVERFYASYQCYPWDAPGGVCNTTPTNLTGTVNPGFASSPQGNSYQLLAKNELKQQFADRLGSTGSPSYLKLWMSENITGVGVGAGQVSICYEPESSTARGGGMGRLSNITNTSATAVACTDSYTGGGSAASCYLCVPQ